MALPDHEKAKLDSFFEEIEPLIAAYRYQKIRYLTVRTNLGFLVLQMVIGLSARPPVPRPNPHKTSHVFGEECHLAAIRHTACSLVEAMTTGPVTINERSLNFPAEAHTGNHNAQHIAFDGGREYPFDRAARLIVMGDNSMFQHAQNELYRRELRAQAVPYDNMPALAKSLGLDIHGVMAFSLEIHASRVAEVTGRQPDGSGQSILEIWLAGRLSTEKLGISLRTTLGHHPGLIPLGRPTRIDWSRDEDGDWIGKAFAAAGSESTIACILNYEGLIQHEATFPPARAKPNTLRTALDVFDPDRKAFLTVIANRELQDRDAQKLEQTVAAILAMRGFRVATVDRVPSLQEVPDILAVDAKGNILVVECTLNMPEAEKKLSKLLKRRDAIRRAFDEQNLQELIVIGVIAVAQSAQTLRPFQPDADKHRIIMWNSDDLAKLESSNELPNSTEILTALHYAVGALDAHELIGRGHDDLPQWEGLGTP